MDIFNVYTKSVDDLHHFAFQIIFLIYRKIDLKEKFTLEQKKIEILCGFFLIHSYNELIVEALYIQMHMHTVISPFPRVRSKASLAMSGPVT